MRARHSLHPIPAFPVYSAAFLANGLLAVGGGGGASRSGIKNKLVSRPSRPSRPTHRLPQRLYTVNNERSIALVGEFELQSGEDAPMSMAADIEVTIHRHLCYPSDAQPQSNTIFCGVNSAAEELDRGENQNCRALAVIDNKYVGF